MLSDVINTPQWGFLDQPIARHECDTPDCVSAQVRFLFHKPNGAVYKCCFGCMNSRAVKKRNHIGEVSGAYAEFTAERESKLKEKWEAIKREQAKIDIEMKVDLALSEGFYKSSAWRQLRFNTLLKHKDNLKCALCSATGHMHVDHIKPRSKFPELALDPENLQILCADCNVGKSNRDTTDFRTPWEAS